MESIILILAILLAFLFGFCVVKRVDRFIDEGETCMKDEIKIKETSSVRLSGNLPLIEIDKEIDKFRQKHPDFEIILRDEEEE